MRNKLSLFFFKLTHWEHWPFYIVYIPVYFYFLWLAMKARSLTFFSASNPGVDTGGIYGESKWSVLKMVPEQFIPKTVFIKAGTPQQATLSALHEAAITFPLIAKPDIGERGFLVEKIDDIATLEKHLARYPVDFLLQEYLDYEHEYNVLFYRLPGEETGKITSVTIKKYMTITGNGKATVEELMRNDTHYALQVERFQKEKAALLKHVPANGEALRIEPIGNHVRGTKFYDGRNLVNQQMLNTFSAIARSISGMYIFRFDAKCKTPDGLATGAVLKFVEVNGAGGEPTHIYETGYPLFKAWGDLLHQWSVIYRVSEINRKKGIAPMSLREGISKLRAYSDYKKKLNR